MLHRSNADLYILMTTNVVLAPSPNCVIKLVFVYFFQQSMVWL